MFLTSCRYVHNDPVNFVDPWGLEWISTGSKWYKFRYKYTAEERRRIATPINSSGISDVPRLFHIVDPLSWIIVPPHEEHPPVVTPTDPDKCD